MISVSERAKTVFTRWVDVWGKHLIKQAMELKEMPDADELDSISFGDIDVGVLSFAVGVLLGVCEPECDHAREDIPYPETCDLCDSLTQRLEISLSYHRKGEKKILLHTIQLDLDEITVDKIYEVIQSYQSTYYSCQCDRLVYDPSDREAPLGKWCMNCYIFRYKRTEEQGGDCCICYENEGRWARFPCGHETHYHCYSKMPANARRCPLCRASITKALADCYDD
jgi:hypothetical protein